MENMFDNQLKKKILFLKTKNNIFKKHHLIVLSCFLNIILKNNYTNYRAWLKNETLYVKVIFKICLKIG